MEVTKLLSERANKIENLKEELHELQYGLDGSEVTHNGKEAVINGFDWSQNAVLLNYDDENYEWVTFK